MSKKIIFSIALLLSAPACAADVLSFLKGDFKEFVNSTVPAAQRERFAGYFEKISEQIKKKDEAGQQELRYTLRKTAIDSLKVEHRTWASDITAFLSDPHYLDAAFDKERGQLRDFLSWYGAYEKFQETTKMKTKVASSDVSKFEASKFLDNMRTQVAKAKDKIGGWLKSLKTRLT